MTPSVHLRALHSVVGAVLFAYFRATSGGVGAELGPDLGTVLGNLLNGADLGLRLRAVLRDL
jgi:hypothetical protein